MARKLEGQDHGLDALIGLVVLLAHVTIGFLCLSALYAIGTTAPPSGATSESINAGFSIALIGSIGIVALSTLVFLIRVAVGRRSWTAPLWGAIGTGFVIVVGYFIMANAF
jgi:hypothetical protein